MPSFPTLKSGAVAQYPSDRARVFSTGVARFVDGSEQRFPKFSAELRRWAIRFELLDEAELHTIDRFVRDQMGRTGVFSFTDPWDDTVYADCSFDGDDLKQVFDGWSRGSTDLVIVENR